MILRIYDFLSEDKPKFSQNLLGVISDCTSLKYTRRAYDIGSFELSVPKNADNADLLLPDRLILFGDDIYARHILGTDTDSLTSDCLYITDVSQNEYAISVSGYDLKYMFAQRLTLFPSAEQDVGTYGYYVTSGTTFGCLSNLLNYNVVNSADNSRKIFGMTALVMPSSQIEAGLMGITKDKCMTRLELLSAVFFKMLKNAKTLFWEVRVAQAVGDGADSYCPRFESIEDKPKVVFCEDKYNIKSYTLDNGVSGYKNAIYAVAGGSDINGAVVKLVNRGTEKTGIERKEVVVTVDTDTVAEIDKYALKAAEDYTVTDSFEVEPLFDEGSEGVCLAQRVAVKINGKVYNTQVVEITDEYTADSKKTTYVTGVKKLKAINVINANTANNTQQIISNKLIKGVGKSVPSFNEIFNDYTGNKVEGAFSHVEGYQNTITNGMGTHAEGINNSINGIYSSVSGQANKVISTSGGVDVSGQSNTVTGGYALSVSGYVNTVNGSYAVDVSGFGNTVTECGATAVSGQSNTVTDSAYSQIGGLSNTANGASRSAISGSGNTVSGIEHIVGGYNNTVSDSRNIVNGMGNTVEGGHDIVGGQSNAVSGHSNGVVGSNNTVSSAFNVVGGQQNNVSGVGNSVAGNDNNVSGDYCGVCGTYNDVDGTGNIVDGYELIVESDTSFSAVFGKYNVAKNIPFAIGGGTGDNARSNIMEFDGDGNLTITGTIEAEGGFVNAPEPPALTNLEIAEMIHNITGG